MLTLGNPHGGYNERRWSGDDDCAGMQIGSTFRASAMLALQSNCSSAERPLTLADLAAQAASDCDGGNTDASDMV